MLSRIWRKHRINTQSAFCTQSAVCILYPVCSLHFVLTRLVLLFLFERASSPDRNIGARKKILVRLSWLLWLFCRLYVEELPRTSTMIGNDYFIPTEDERKCAVYQYSCLWCSSAWSQRVLKWTRCGSPRCEHFGFSIQVAFLEVRKCNLRILFLLNHTNILFLSTWVSELHRN